MVVPIHAGGELVGALGLGSPRVGRFTQEDPAGLEEFVRVLAAEGRFCGGPIGAKLRKSGFAALHHIGASSFCSSSPNRTPCARMDLLGSQQAKALKTPCFQGFFTLSLLYSANLPGRRPGALFLMPAGLPL